MGRVVNLTPTAMKVSMFGDNSSYMGDYLQHQMSNIASKFGAMGNQIYDTLANSYNYLTDSLRKYSIRNELEREGVIELDNHFEYIDTFEGLQNANVAMQRWIMAEPTIRAIYLEQNCNGYGKEYINLSGDTVGEENYDYRRVMNGILTIDENDYNTAPTYIDDLIEGDRELELYEQDRVIQTWQAMRHIMATCKYDFTKNSEKPENMCI